MWKRNEEYLSGEPPEEVSPFVDGLALFLVAFLGSTMLVVPMLIMRLPEITVVKSLVTVSTAVLLFAAALSVLFRVSNTETIIATATYAAVLVFFWVFRAEVGRKCYGD
jgi:VIT1/CCC1 family predicted Fe2+/Mn2+ transporter